MKKCPICESNIDDSKDSCYICGSSLKDYVIEKKKADSLPSEKHDESNDTAKSGASTFHIIVTGVLVIWVIICFFAHICQTPICSNCGNEETYCECGLNYDMLSYKFDTLYEYTNALNEFSLGRYESAIDLLEGVDRSELIDIGLSIDIDGLIAECNYRIATSYNYADAKKTYQKSYKPITIVNVRSREGYNPDAGFGLNDNGEAIIWNLEIELINCNDVEKVTCSWDENISCINGLTNIYVWESSKSGNTHWETYVNYESKHFLVISLPNKQTIEGRQYIILNGTKISFDLIWLGGYSEGYGWGVSNIEID